MATHYTDIDGVWDATMGPDGELVSAVLVAPSPFFEEKRKAWSQPNGQSQETVSLTQDEIVSLKALLVKQSPT